MKWLALCLFFGSASSSFAASCDADCKVSCKQTLFIEAPNEFTRQKCTDMGGTLDSTAKAGTCVTYYELSTTVSGYGSLKSEAMQQAKSSCISYLPSDCWSDWKYFNVSNYRCQ